MHEKKIHEENIHNLIKVIDAYGANQEKWPQEKREDLKKIYQQLKKNSKYAPQLHQAIKRAQTIDAMLEENRHIPIPEDITKNIINAIEKTKYQPRQNKKNLSNAITQKSHNPKKFHNSRRNIKINPNWILLAASFIIGIYIGNTTYIVDPILYNLIPQNWENGFDEIISIQYFIEEIIS